jgi:uncharacterized protein YoxC
MLMSLAIAVQQPDAIVAQLDRMSSALVILSWAIGIVGLLSIAAILFSLYTVRSAFQLIATIEAQISRLGPRTEPLLEKLTRLADDVRGITDVVRRRILDVMDTVGDLNDSVAGARNEAEMRIREFGAVLDVVQTEAEQLLLDAAAAARGVQVTAAALRAARPRPVRPRDDDDDESFDIDDDDESFDAGDDEAFDDGDDEAFDDGDDEAFDDDDDELFDADDDEAVETDDELEAGMEDDDTEDPASANPEFDRENA